MTISEKLAQFVSDTTYRDIPEAALVAAKRSLFDTLAVALGGRDAAGVPEAIDFSLEERGSAASSVWVSEHRVPPRAAAFVNSVLASALDFDSLYSEGVVHADIVIVPAALAVAEARGASGRELLTAIAVGDDMLCRLGRSTRLDRGWFYTSIYGSIAGAAITAKLLGGKARQIAGAMGLGFMSSSGTQQPAVERSIGKRMQGALAASAGVLAGHLGARDLSGPREIFEGRFGLYGMYEKGDPEEITRDLGNRFENAKIMYKLFPSCQCNHAAIEGMLQLSSEFGLRAAEVKSVEVVVSEYMQRLVGAPFSPGADPQVAAQFSIQYSIAAVLLFGRLGVTEIRAPAVLDPRIKELVARITVSLDDTNTHNYAPVRLKVIKQDDAVIVRSISTYRGSVDVPLSDTDLKEKLAMCLEGAGRPASSSQVDAFFDAVMNIDQCPNVTVAMPRIIQNHLH